MRPLATALDGAWPSGKATGFGPVIPGSNPGAPAPNTDRPLPRMTHGSPLACVLLAAGQGTRMRSSTPKVLHEILGRSLIDWAVAGCLESEPDRMLVVVPPGAEAIRERLPAGVEPVTQERPLGTGDAVRAARGALEGFDGDVLVLYADHPLTDPASSPGAAGDACRGRRRRHRPDLRADRRHRHRLRAHRPGRRRRCRTHRRGARRLRRRAGHHRGELGHLRLPLRRPVARARGARRRPTTRASST